MVVRRQPVSPVITGTSAGAGAAGRLRRLVTERAERVRRRRVDRAEPVSAGDRFEDDELTPVALDPRSSPHAGEALAAPSNAAGQERLERLGDGEGSGHAAPSSQAAMAQPSQHNPVLADTVLAAVMALDHDGTGTITAADHRAALAAGVPFEVTITVEGRTEVFSGPERLAHVAERSANAVRERGPLAELPIDELRQPPGAALAQNISDAWPALVRNSSEVRSIVAALKATNLPAPDGKLHLWVPATDAKALARLKREAARYNEQRAIVAEAEGQPRPTDTLEIEVFKKGMNWRELDERKPGLLYLPQSYVVPGGRFSEMYGWDSYFIGQGLIASGRYDLARGMVENQVYLIEHYGKIPNSSRSYHLSRSQPPFLPRLALELHDAAPTEENRQLLKHVLRAAQKELKQVWYAAPQRTESGLSRFHDDATGPDLEVERNLVANGVFAWPDPEADRAARAFGWDLTHRTADHAHLLEPVDLNAELYRYEKDVAEIARRVEGDDSRLALVYENAAAVRAAPMQRRLWSQSKGLFFDYDLKTKTQTGYESLATFAPLWAKCATPEQAALVVAQIGKFMCRGGLATSSKKSRDAAGEEALQWDWPNVWMPLQVIAVDGCRNYGFDDEANEIAYRACAAVLSIAGENNGLIPEKWDGVRVSADVEAAEYGNQGGSRGQYSVPREENPLGFAWSNAGFLKLRNGLPPKLRHALDRGVSPDELFGAVP